MSSEQYINLFADKLSGPLICHFGGKPLTPYQFAAALVKVIAAIGLDKELYKSHSAMLLAKVHCLNCCTESRWTSDLLSACLVLYIATNYMEVLAEA